MWYGQGRGGGEGEREGRVGAVLLSPGGFARQLEGLLRAGTYELAAERPVPCPDAPSRPLAQAYAMARERVAATALSVGRGHQREHEERLGRQVERMERYYGDLRDELKERLARARQDGRTSPKTVASLEERLAGIDREERVRVDELRRRSALRVSVRLTNLLLLAYPKLRVAATLTPKRGPDLSLDLVWDPLAGQLEPADCPSCSRATRQLSQGGRGEWVCPGCGGEPTRGSHERAR